jgi:flagellar biosynthetic protein FliR
MHRGLAVSASGFPDLFAPGVATAFILTLLRVAGLMLAAPVWSAQSVPMKLRTALIVIFAVLLLPASTSNANLPALRISPATFLSESIIGFVIGMAAAITVAAAEFAGELITTTAGLSGAAIMDPVNNTQHPILAGFMQLMALVLLVISGGHVLMITAVGNSFHAMPLGAPFDLAAGMGAFVPMARVIFVTGLQFAAPVIAAVFVTNVALAVLGRAAPQLQIMSVAFPMQIGIGLLTFAGSVALVVHVMTDWTPGFANSLDVFARASGASTAAANATARTAPLPSITTGH